MKTFLSVKSKHIKKYAFIVFSILLLSCDNEPDSDIISWQKNWNKWNDLNLSNYSYVFRASCYCINEWVSEVKVTISNDTISNVVFTSNDLSPTTLKPNQWHTIDELFDIAKAAIDEAYTYKVEYNNALFGHPTMIDIDWAENTADDEVTFFINNVSSEK